MDIYQIIITHNRAWTIREVICFSVIFCLALILALRLLRKRKLMCLRPYPAFSF